MKEGSVLALVLIEYHSEHDVNRRKDYVHFIDTGVSFILTSTIFTRILTYHENDKRFQRFYYIDFLCYEQFGHNFIDLSYKWRIVKVIISHFQVTLFSLVTMQGIISNKLIK